MKRYFELKVETESQICSTKITRLIVVPIPQSYEKQQLNISRVTYHQGFEEIRRENLIATFFYYRITLPPFRRYVLIKYVMHRCKGVLRHHDISTFCVSSVKARNKNCDAY